MLKIFALPKEKIEVKINIHIYELMHKGKRILILPHNKKYLGYLFGGKQILRP